MVEAKVSAQEQFQDQLMEICSCGKCNAIFYCTKNPHCYGQDRKEQMFYCSECMENFHPHQPIRIARVNNELGKNWSLLFEKIDNVYAIGSKIYEELENFILFCESENNKLPQGKKYIGPSYVDDFVKFLELHKLVILENKEKIEILIKDIKLKEILILDQKFKESNALIQYLEYWTTMTEDKVFYRYLNVFLVSREGSYDKFSKETLKTILKYKTQVIKQIASQPADPQNQISNDNFSSLIKLNNESILIADSRIEKTVQQCGEKITNLSTQVSQAHKQIKESLEQLRGKATAMNTQITQKQQETDQEIKVIKDLVKDLETTQTNQHLNVNENKTTLQTELNQFMRFSFSVFQLYDNRKGEAFEQSLCKLLNKQIISNSQIWNILQIQDSGYIVASPNNSETYVYDAITLKQFHKLPITSLVIFSAIELQNYIFITDYDYQIFMVDSSDFTLIQTFRDEDGFQDIISMCGVDNNHFITGSVNGFLYIFNIENTTLTKAHSKQYYKDKQIHQIVKLNAADQMAVSADGVKIIKVIDNNEIQQLSNYLTGQTISSIIEYQNQQLICGSYSKKCYYLIDLQAKTKTKLVNGYSPVLAMTLFPDFHFKDYPFILTKELDWVCIINVKTQFIYKLAKCSGQFDAQFYKLGSSIIFLKDQGLKFITFDQQFELARYKIEENLMKFLAFA